MVEVDSEALAPSIDTVLIILSPVATIDGKALIPLIFIPAYISLTLQLYGRDLTTKLYDRDLITKVRTK